MRCLVVIMSNIQMKYLSVLNILLLMACSGEAENEVVSMDDLMGETGSYEVDSSEIETGSKIDDNSVYGQFADSQLDMYDTTAHNEFHLLDRFGFSKSQKLLFTGKEDVPYGRNGRATPKAYLFCYNFSDSSKTNNAFYNYLDGMPEEGEGGPVRLLEDVASIKMPPMHMIVYDSSIVTIRYTCEAEENDWDSFEDSLIAKYGRAYRYRFDVDCGGPLKWEKYP